jgi:hypothetical protein
MTDRELLEQILSLLTQSMKDNNQQFERIFWEFNMFERRFSNVDQRLLLMQEDIT